MFDKQSIAFGVLVLICVLGGVLFFVDLGEPEQGEQLTGCREDALVCPDGTILGRTGADCSFPSCPEATDDGGKAGADTQETPGAPLSQEVYACVRAGCSSTLCVDERMAGEIMTTCEELPEYACYQDAVCERQADGMCGWRMTTELTQCISTHRADEY